VLAASGLGAGLLYGLRIHDVGGQVGRLLAAGLVQAPAVLAVAGVAVLLFGLLPRWAVAGGWTALALAAIITMFGPAIRLTQWALDVSPFSHVPKLPGGVVTATPLVWLVVAALALTVAGLATLRRRDMALS
jgi:ABC-2 type transport system permease protein